MMMTTLALAGCVNFEMTPDTAGGMPTLNVCQTYAAAKAGNASKASGVTAAQELARRPDFTVQEVKLIAKGIAAPGMSEAAGLCAWGGYWNDVNVTTTGSGSVKQYVFGDGQYIKRRYLYAKNGRVISTQE